MPWQRVSIYKTTANALGIIDWSALKGMDEPLVDRCDSSIVWLRSKRARILERARRVSRPYCCAPTCKNRLSRTETDSCGRPPGDRLIECASAAFASDTATIRPRSTWPNWPLLSRTDWSSNWRKGNAAEALAIPSVSASSKDHPWSVMRPISPHLLVATCNR